ncbi:MAG: PilZ domain-containing protein [Pseudomonadota bacterium]
MKNDNRRSESRLADSAALFVEVRAASPDGSTPAEILACSGVDMSANGLQVQVDRPLPVGAILRLGCDMGRHSPPMYVVGEVRWCREENGGHAIGFLLFDSDGTDIVAWKQFIAARLSD